MIAFAFASSFVAIAASAGFLAVVRAQVGSLQQRAQAGDVDTNGDIVDELRERLDGAIGDTAGVDRGQHLDIVLADLLRLRIARGRYDA